MVCFYMFFVCVWIPSANITCFFSICCQASNLHCTHTLTIFADDLFLCCSFVFVHNSNNNEKKNFSLRSIQLFCISRWRWRADFSIYTSLLHGSFINRLKNICASSLATRYCVCVYTERNNETFILKYITIALKIFRNMI